MKIRKKLPKPAPAKPPLYIIGYRDSAPSIDELKSWYDLNHGGPLTCSGSDAGRSVSLSHGPWHARLLMSLPETDAAEWHRILSWDHRTLSAVSAASAIPGTIADTVLVAARLARGLALITQGTAFDIACHEYLNPSDWNDRPLDVFQVRDHVSVQHHETDDSTADWFYTLGLSKFGLDELEVIQPRGLPEIETITLLMSAADRVLQGGTNQKIGTSLDLLSLAHTIRFTRHRTAAPAGHMVAFRQITIESS
ncbi:MAG: hypothetical protein OJF47_003321 [Nitrospira sp.]|jgi:hypothetical protein|nr:MAG: hypothetical protein OJF47_003321 [Nitrospira sp.]